MYSWRFWSESFFSLDARRNTAVASTVALHFFVTQHCCSSRNAFADRTESTCACNNLGKEDQEQEVGQEQEQELRN